MSTTYRTRRADTLAAMRTGHLTPEEASALLAPWHPRPSARNSLAIHTTEHRAELDRPHRAAAAAQRSAHRAEVNAAARLATEQHKEHHAQRVALAHRAHTAAVVAPGPRRYFTRHRLTVSVGPRTPATYDPQTDTYQPGPRSLIVDTFTEQYRAGAWRRLATADHLLPQIEHRPTEPASTRPKRTTAPDLPQHIAEVFARSMASESSRLADDLYDPTRPPTVPAGTPDEAEPNRQKLATVEWIDAAPLNTYERQRQRLGKLDTHQHEQHEHHTAQIPAASTGTPPPIGPRPRGTKTRHARTTWTGPAWLAPAPGEPISYDPEHARRYFEVLAHLIGPAARWNWDRSTVELTTSGTRAKRAKKRTTDAVADDLTEAPAGAPQKRPTLAQRIAQWDAALADT